MKKLFIFGLLVINLFAYTQQEKNEVRSEKFLMNIANSLNKTLPMRLDKYTILNNVYVSKANINYVYMTNVTPKIFNKIKNKLKYKITSSICNIKNIKLFLDAGIVITYKYYDTNAHFLGKFNIVKKDCQ